MIINILIRPFVRVKYFGSKNIPRRGAFILCSNHISYSDPLILAMGVNRRICFMAKSELFAHGRGLILRILGAFPVRRGKPDAAALNCAAHRLFRGLAVGIFPQGGIYPQYMEFRFRAGASALSVRTGAAVLPAYISASPEGRLVRFGPLLSPPPDNSPEAVRIFNESIKQAVTQLREEYK